MSEKDIKLILRIYSETSDMSGPGDYQSQNLYFKDSNDQIYVAKTIEGEPIRIIKSDGQDMQEELFIYIQEFLEIKRKYYFEKEYSKYSEKYYFSLELKHDKPSTEYSCDRFCATLYEHEKNEYNELITDIFNAIYEAGKEEVCIVLENQKILIPSQNTTQNISKKEI